MPGEDYQQYNAPLLNPVFYELGCQVYPKSNLTFGAGVLTF